MSIPIMTPVGELRCGDVTPWYVVLTKPIVDDGVGAQVQFRGDGGQSIREWHDASIEVPVLANVEEDDWLPTVQGSMWERAQTYIWANE